jgi:Neuraminidase (sialidase)
MKNPLGLLATTAIGEVQVSLASLPAGLRVDEDLALVLGIPVLTGQVVHEAAGSLFEVRATKTPGGDYLLMFPTNCPGSKGNCHYGGNGEKTNDMVAYRSCDGGHTWQGPTVAFDIDYNQHGFIPLIPAGSKRIYAFGTQPVWHSYQRSHGLNENAPIGYRYSDDDGHHWSEVRLIRPENDPDFRGMSVMRMCETGNGTWLLGAHEGDWSYRPLMTRQYILRSEDQGRTWQVGPHARHGGWCVPQFNRMDEGRPISLGGSRALLMIRTCEGHLWTARSDDDGKTWSDPAPTPLIHPDAPPMLFHLSDGKTLAAFHHNRHHDLNYAGLGDNQGMQDRSELWVSLSTDDGETWSEPRFVLANAAEPGTGNRFFDYQYSYLDAFADSGELHLFLPHRWQRCLHLRLRESALKLLPTAGEMI